MILRYIVDILVIDSDLQEDFDKIYNINVSNLIKLAMIIIMLIFYIWIEIFRIFVFILPL